MGNKRKADQKFRDMMNGGCSAFSWETEDGSHLWGRNFDFNRLTEGSQVMYIPRESKFYTYGTELENSLDETSCQMSMYGAVGVGIQIFPSTPVLYEGMNEKGLMGGQLLYRNFAHFDKKSRGGTLALHPAFAVTYFLTRCESVRQIAEEIRDRVTFVGTPLLGTVPTIHWMFSDRSGESIVIESDRNGVHVYRDTLGIMTNAPSYEWHCQNLLSYAQIRNLDYEEVKIGGKIIEQCYSGSGALGMPGDWSSPSRFVRLAFLKKYAVKGEREEEGISYLFRLLSHVAFPYGMVKVTENGVITEYDREITPYDYTIYSVAMCAESLKFYWISYENPKVQYVSLKDLLKYKTIRQICLGRKTDFQCVTERMESADS